MVARAQYLSEPTEEELTDGNSIKFYMPTASAKKRRRLAEDGGMTNDNQIATLSSKKRKVLPVRAKSVKSVKSPKSPRGVKDTIPVVEIPAKKMILDVEMEEDETASPSKMEQEEPQEEPQEDIVSASKHRRFASEELSDDLFSIAGGKVVEKNEDIAQVVSSDEESGDEAPEALDIQEAAKTAKSKEREAAKAVTE